MNFNFSKHIVSKKIDIEVTEEQYTTARQEKVIKLSELTNQLKILESQKENDDSDGELQYEIRKINRRILVLEQSIEYLDHQIAYLESTTSNIAGSTKSVYYSASANLDVEALKGLKPSEEVEAYEKNVKDRMQAMASSLSGTGVKSTMLTDIELLDLARTHYKPYISTVFKTKHLMNEVNLETDINLNKGIFAKMKVHEVYKREMQKNGTEN